MNGIRVTIHVPNRRCADASPSLCRRYIPILKDFPNRYIYEPWNAPESVQKAANCVVGVDYPKPMVNHAESSRLNIERMKQVYQQLSHYRGLSKTRSEIQQNLFSVYSVSLHLKVLIHETFCASQVCWRLCRPSRRRRSLR